VYLNQAATAVLLSVPRTKVKIFPDVSPGQVTVAFRRVCRKIELEDFRFHDLRHTAASWLRMAGEDIHTVASLLGHKDLRMAARYQHLSPNYLTAAVSKLDTVFGHHSVTSDLLVEVDNSASY
jgi:integrase